MSLPQFPVKPSLSREECINQIIASIAMEELALSHIINAEGEKLQYILGTASGSSGPGPTIEEVLKVNECVQSVLQSVAECQSVLRNKLQMALSSATLTGPAGAPGSIGPRGATGAPGATGSIGPAGTGIGLIPFATGYNDVPGLHSVNGHATNAMFVGFGSSSDAVAITETGFSMPSGNKYFFPISLARTITIKSIHLTTANYANFEPGAGAAIHPFIILATANEGENNFKLLSATKTTVTTPWSGSSTIPMNSTLYGSRVDINQTIPAGSRLAICCAVDMSGGKSPLLGYFFYYSGSIYYEYKTTV